MQATILQAADWTWSSFKLDTIVCLVVNRGCNRGKNGAVVNTTRLEPENTLILNEIGTFIAVQVLQPGIHGPQTLYLKGFIPNHILEIRLMWTFF